MKPWRIVGILGVVALGVTAFASGSSGTTTITVGAASSLTTVLPTIGEDFMRENPGITVRFSFAASSAIAEQITQGAPIDAFASAGTSAMQPLADAQAVTDVRAFASNSLQIAVPPGNPGAVAGLGDLGRVTVVICQEQVPCGAATMKLFAANDLAIEPVSLEPDVRSVLTKIETDEADAGIVYVTDVLAAGGTVMGIDIPAEQNVTTLLQAAVVKDSAQANAAAAFVEYLSGAQARARLAAAGFADPT